MPKPTYDTTVARIAGNIASGLISHGEHRRVDHDRDKIARLSVEMARAIVAEVRRTDPAPAGQTEER